MTEPAAKRAKPFAVRNLRQWVDENRDQFHPPVCNKMMENDGQLKIMFVGGPNSRKDYHCEAGEELFFMVEGDMHLDVMEKGQPKSIPIKQGELFLLPGHIPHSPQRQANTVGLVIERERCKGEWDGLRWYQPDQPTEVLYEDWFLEMDLSMMIKPAIEKYLASEQHKTQKPDPAKKDFVPPLSLDTTTELPPAFSLDQWLAEHPDDEQIFDTAKFETQMRAVRAAASGTTPAAPMEAWFWQYKGESSLDVDGEGTPLKEMDVVLFTDAVSYTWTQTPGSIGFIITMTPAKQ